jgi:hypothetical protein
VYAPFFPHILDAWSKRHHPNMHFMFYEDMKKVILVNSLTPNYAKNMDPNAS